MAKQKQKVERKVTIENHEIANFFAGPYYDYAIYVLEQRAIPSIIDGLKPGARKIINAAFKTLPNTKVETKFLDLVGSTMSISKYHHGDSSIEGTIVTLGQHFVIKRQYHAFLCIDITLLRYCLGGTPTVFWNIL